MLIYSQRYVTSTGSLQWCHRTLRIRSRRCQNSGGVRRRSALLRSFFSIAQSDCVFPGNIAIGNLHLFLPFIVHLVKQDDSKRLLALHALKEVVTHTSTSHLENVAETLWVPLFENSESADESSRGVAAACIGKLITTHPARYLPQVHVWHTRILYR